MSKPIVRVVAHKEFLIIIGPENVSNDVFLPAGHGRIGCLLLNDVANNLGISKDAAKLLQGIPKGTDCIGDVDCFKAGKETIFGWLGGTVSVKDTSDDLVGSRTWNFDNLPHVTIPNEVPSDILEAFAKL